MKNIIALTIFALMMCGFSCGQEDVSIDALDMEVVEQSLDGHLPFPVANRLSQSNWFYGAIGFLIALALSMWFLPRNDPDQGIAPSKNVLFWSNIVRIVLFLGLAFCMIRPIYLTIQNLP